ncbi:MAG TPA: hypothetical protein VNO50_09950 [Pyrinomonadaceae bacterium]|nr:hypothetical protein [Pyrinomonadaceae bacterium]
MKLFIRMVLVVSFASAAALTVVPQKMPPVRIEGTYENLTVGKESGDLVGMRVMLIDGGGGIHAIVQEAGGGVELPDPATAKVDVNGAKVSFTIKLAGRDEEETFSGTVTTAGLSIRRGPTTGPNAEKPVLLKRKRC